MMEPLPFVPRNAPLPKSWLLRRVAVIDRQSLARYKWAARKSSPINTKSVVGTIQPEWWASAGDLLPKVWPGDEIWYFESDPVSWQFLAGRAGYAIVYHGSPMYYTVTRLN